MCRNMSINSSKHQVIVTLILVVLCCGQRKKIQVMHPTATYQIEQVYQRYTDPNQAGRLKKLTIDVANCKIKMTRRRITVNTLERLIKYGVGTNEVEHVSRRLSWGGNQLRPHNRERRRRQFVEREMRARRTHALGDWHREKKRYIRCHRYLYSVINQCFTFQGMLARQVKRNIGEIIQSEVELVWQTGCEKMKDKVRHLVSKWNRRSKEGEELYGIAISDQDLDQFCVTGGIDEHGLKINCDLQDPPIYGGCNISENQKAILSLPPKFTTYAEISEKEMEVEMEVAMCKLRWELMNREERENRVWTKEWEMERMERESTYDWNSKELDFRNKRVTDLPTCRRVNLPGPQDEDNEIVMRNMT